MTTELEQTHTHDQTVHMRRGGTRDPADATRLTKRPTDDDAWAQVQAILAKSQPYTANFHQLVGALGDPHKVELAKRIGTLAKLVPGDVVLDVAEIVKAPPVTTVETSLHGADKPSPARLRRYLRLIDGDNLAQLVGATFNEVRAILKGPLVDELPHAVLWLRAFEHHAGFLGWFVKTTSDLTVCAEQFGIHGTSVMAATLDNNKLWNWHTHATPAHAGGGLIALAQATGNDVVRARLQKVIGPSAKLTPEELMAFRDQHARDVTAELDGNPTIQGLLAAIGRVNVLDDRELTRVLDAFERLHATADDILTLAAQNALDVRRALRLLLAARGVTAHHVTSFLFQGTNRLEALADDHLSFAAQSKVKGLRLQDLMEKKPGPEFHQMIVLKDGLRTWFLREASPSELLWFGSQTVHLVPRTMRHLARHDPSWGWVHELTSSNDQQALYVLAHNCPQQAAREYVRRTLLGVQDGAPTELVDSPLEIDTRTQSGEVERFKQALHGPAQEVMDRLADVQAKDRAKLGTDEAIVKRVATDVGIAHFPRAAFLLDLTSERATVASVGKSPGMLSYVRSRPPAEEAAVLLKPEAVQRAAWSVHQDLLLVFPSLQRPEVLAEAIETTPALVKLLFVGSDPNAVVDLLSRDVVFAKAEPVLEQTPVLMNRIPRYQELGKRGRTGVDRMAKAATGNDSQVRYATEDIKTGDHEPTLETRDESKRFHTADQLPLPAAIDALVKAKGSAASALGLLDSHRQELPELLADSRHAKRVKALAGLVEVPPDLACPGIAIESLLAMPNALEWYFAYPSHLFHLLVKAPRLPLVAGAINSNTEAAAEWLRRLPSGAHLTDDEEVILDRLFPLITTRGATAALIQVRFGMPAPKQYDQATVAQLYRVVSRLPSTHLQQERISRIVQEPIHNNEAAGMYRSDGKHGEIEIDDDVAPGRSKDTFHASARNQWMSRAELREVFEFDDKTFDAHVKAHNIEQRQTAKGLEYRMKEVKFDLFTQVVLHEIGHAVDDILGKRTQPVFGFAGWREYSDKDFDKWATELGGWDKVRPADKPRIRDVWIDANRTSGRVKDLVPADHPALAKEYQSAGVGIVQHAIAGKTLRYSEAPVEHGGRVCFAPETYNSWYSVDAAAVKSAPSVYSLYAPAEYFAECYVEYYRQVDGSPGAGARKGGGLPGPVKQWFDGHVDTLRYDPARLDGRAKKDA